MYLALELDRESPVSGDACCRGYARASFVWRQQHFASQLRLTCNRCRHLEAHIPVVDAVYQGTVMQKYYRQLWRRSSIE